MWLLAAVGQPPLIVVLVVVGFVSTVGICPAGTSDPGLGPPPAAGWTPAAVASSGTGSSLVRAPPDQLGGARTPAPGPPSEAGIPAPDPPTGAGVPAPGARYAWPLHPAPVVLAPFRAPDHRYGPGHRGADLAGAVGQPVLAARAGVVLFAGPVGGRGVVSVLHDDALRTTYEPVDPTVQVGSSVAAGVVLGTLMAGHRGCPAACLHWGVRRDRLDYLDPLVLVRPTRLRLLPVPAR